MTSPTPQTVCVAIACYNQARFLADAVRSVLAQTRSVDEIIVVDDGSTDETERVARQFELVRLIQQPNSGLSAARNTALRESSCQFILFLDADDRILPRSIELGLRCLESSTECAFATGHYRFIDEDGVPTQQWAPQPIEADSHASFLRGNPIGMHATVLYRRRMLEEAGGFDQTLPACEDYDVYLRLSKQYPVCRYHDLVAEYRQHGDNMSSDLSLMLPTVLSVLKRYAPGKLQPERRSAYNDGVHGWKSHYGYRYFENRSASPDTARQDRMTLIRNAPLVTSRIVAGHWFHKVRSFAANVLGVSNRSNNIGSVKLGDLGGKTYAGSPSDFSIEQTYIEKFLDEQPPNTGERRVAVLIDERFRSLAKSKYENAETLAMDRSNSNAESQLASSIESLKNSGPYDVISAVHSLPHLYKVGEALADLEQCLAPGGQLLATFPGTGHFGPKEQEPYWILTPFALRHLAKTNLTTSTSFVTAYGNVLSAIAMLHHVNVATFTEEELAVRDQQYPLVVGLSAVKS